MLTAKVTENPLGFIARYLKDRNPHVPAPAPGTPNGAEEAEEGTEQMLRRCATLPAQIIGSDAARLGVCRADARQQLERNRTGQGNDHLSPPIGHLTPRK